MSLNTSPTKPLAVITGASRGLGFESARGLASAGFDLALVAKDEAGLQDAARRLLVEFPDLEVYCCPANLEQPDATRAVISKISTLGQVTVLMVAHGVMSEKMSKTLRTNDAEWHRVMAINLDSVFALLNGLVPAMVEARLGRVIVYSACMGRMSGPGNTGGYAPYRVSKAGVNALVRNLAHETGLGSRGVLVDAVCPNHSRTDMGGPNAPRSAAEGAATSIWLATRAFESGDITGVLWEDQQIVPW
ncbi:MAG: SDR family NAD(P)-dependent oxidoreductase [Actinomycetota bacterium]|nr:SDR family NAD(P)-dependent oxidoreductase [Actinomycetota bacterium]